MRIDGILYFGESVYEVGRVEFEIELFYLFLFILELFIKNFILIKELVEKENVK